MTRLAKGALLVSSRVGAHGEIHRRVIGDVEKQDLGAARDQDPFEHAAIAREAFLDQLAQGEADRSEAAQADCDDGAGKAAIAFFEADEPRRRGVGREFLVQRMAALHDVAQDRGGGDARGKPRMREGIVRRIVPPVAVRGRLVLAGPAESLAEIAVHSPRDQVGVARRSVSIMNRPVQFFYHSDARIEMRIPASLIRRRSIRRRVGAKVWRWRKTRTAVPTPERLKSRRF